MAPDEPPAVADHNGDPLLRGLRVLRGGFIVQPPVVGRRVGLEPAATANDGWRTGSLEATVRGCGPQDCTSALEAMLAARRQLGDAR